MWTPDDPLEQDRQVLAVYEGVVLACVEWVREHRPPGFAESAGIRGILDQLVKHGIAARERFLPQFTGLAPPPTANQVRSDVRLVEELIWKAINFAGAEARELLDPYIRELDRITAGQGAGLLWAIRRR